MINIKIISIFSIFLLTLVAGIKPLMKSKVSSVKEGISSDALASGVFLGAGLMHLLSESTHKFILAGMKFPLSFFLTGITFLSLLWIEKVGHTLSKEKNKSKLMMAFIALFMLSVHSVLEGAALGLTSTTATTTIILFVILAHKWAESYALAIQISRGTDSSKFRIYSFLFFCCMTPLGIIMGNSFMQHATKYQILGPCFEAVGAGTFLYLGILHGLNDCPMIKTQKNSKEFLMILFGFSIMAGVSLYS